MSRFLELYKDFCASDNNLESYSSTSVTGKGNGLVFSIFAGSTRSLKNIAIEAVKYVEEGATDKSVRQNQFKAYNQSALQAGYFIYDKNTDIYSITQKGQCIKSLVAQPELSTQEHIFCLTLISLLDGRFRNPEGKEEDTCFVRNTIKLIGIFNNLDYSIEEINNLCSSFLREKDTPDFKPWKHKIFWLLSFYQDQSFLKTIKDCDYDSIDEVINYIDENKRSRNYIDIVSKKYSGGQYQVGTFIEDVEIISAIIQLVLKIHTINTPSELWSVILDNVSKSRNIDIDLIMSKIDENKDVFDNIFNNIKNDPYISSISALINTCKKSTKTIMSPILQKIFYGAPGTGKSHATNEVTSKYPDTVRTTFHPDSDYSTFVGAYKPTMTKERKAVVIGQDEKEVNPLTDNSEWVEKISYKFVKQAFLKAYVKAWKKFKDTYVDGGELAPQFLVIEEINRGNCAQIFGDLFQLLDRKANFSEYPIEADSDICKALLEEDTDENPSFGAEGLKLSDEQKASINSIFDKEGEVSQQVAEKICKGEVLVLPPNLYIWATMNTSDQSLFPIDSAFKRRWEWKYVRINEGKAKDKQPLNFRIKFNVTDTEVVDESWWEFIKAINTKIEEATKSEDKKLGYFFCKPDKKAEGAGENDENTIISAETFVGKVVFYLWQDVFKDYGFKSDIFKKDDGKRLAFHDFYPDNIEPDEEKNPEAIDLKLVKRFIEKVMNKKAAEPTTPAPTESAEE